MPSNSDRQPFDDIFEVPLTELYTEDWGVWHFDAMKKEIIITRNEDANSFPNNPCIFAAKNVKNCGRIWLETSPMLEKYSRS